MAMAAMTTMFRALDQLLKYFFLMVRSLTISESDARATNTMSMVQVRWAAVVLARTASTCWSWPHWIV